MLLPVSCTENGSRGGEPGSNPCKECPFARNWAGWLGPYESSDELIDHIFHDGFFACHMTLGKGDDDEDEDDPHLNARHCVGALIFMNQSAKMSRNPEILQLQRAAPKTHPKVFRRRTEMTEFHGK